MSQRTDGFVGGIQPGTTASSRASISLESRLTEAAGLVLADHPRFEWIPEMGAAELSRRLGVPGQMPGLRPDGGLLIARASGRVVWAAEAKKQGPVGNAIERWYKNWELLRALGVQRYVTFCSGEGFFDGNSAERILAAAQVLDRQRARRYLRFWNPKAEAGWNEAAGRLWLYRYRDAPAAEDLVAVIEKSLQGLG